MQEIVVEAVLVIVKEAAKGIANRVAVVVVNMIVVHLVVMPVQTIVLHIVIMVVPEKQVIHLILNVATICVLNRC